MKKIIGLLSCLFLFVGQSWSQEKLYLKNQKEPIACQIIEINTSEVKYKPSDAEQLVVGVAKNDVEKIVFKSGRVQYFTDPLEDFAHYKGQKHWIAKVGILSPAFGFTDLYLEKSLKPGRSIEFQANIIGLGKNMSYYTSYSQEEMFINQRGASVGVGMKVLRMPDFELSNRKLLHILQGGYLKPAVQIGYYQRNIIYTDPINYVTKSQNRGIITSMVSVTVGKQWILDNTFSIDIYGLLGLGIDNFRSQQVKIRTEVGGRDPYFNDETLPYQNFGYTRFGRGDVGIAVGGGIKVGYLFNVKKKKSSKGLDKMRNRLHQ